MRILIVGHNTARLAATAKKTRGLQILDARDEAAPDVIVTHGGDGAVIGAEKEWPGIPKLGIRDSASCVKCTRHRDRDVLQRLAAGDYDVATMMKLSASVGDHRFLGLNDVLLRNSDIRSACRFVVYVNDEQATDEIIGDGLVASTPFGSSAYFRSITNTTFRSGIGLAFNNCTDFVNHFVLLERDVVRVHVVRGPADLTADNDPGIVRVDSDEDIVIRRARRHARIVSPDTLRCSRCRYKHAPRRRF